MQIRSELEFKVKSQLTKIVGNLPSNDLLKLLLDSFYPNNFKIKSRRWLIWGEIFLLSAIFYFRQW